MPAFDPTQDPGFLAELQAAFQIEAAEHLQAMSAGLLSLEKAPDAERAPLLEKVYREAHSLKGAARAVNRADLEALCQQLEQALSGWRRGEVPLDAKGLDRLQLTLDDALRMLRGGAAAPATAAPAPTAAAAGGLATPETIRVATEKLDRLMLQAEEMLAAKLATGQRAADLRVLQLSLEQWQVAWGGLQPDVRRSLSAHEATPMLAFIDWNHGWVKTLESRLRSLTEATTQDLRLIGHGVDVLRKDAKALLMTPMAQLLAPLPRLVHDLCRDEGKEAELVLQGEEVEIDKRILEEMKDPLVHLLRNCVDHGVEKPEQRRKEGKPRQGVITVTIKQVENNQVEIRVADDGSGINLAGLRDSAVRQGLVTAQRAARLSEQETYPLLFESGISTRDSVTALSGRGLGMAIVREKCDKLGGRVSVQSTRGRGTEFRILLPLTLATFRGLLVAASGQFFAIPLGSVERVGRIRRSEVAGRNDGQVTVKPFRASMPLVPLADVLALPPQPAGAAGEFIPVVVMEAADHRVAFAVEAVLYEEEVLVKRISGPLARVRHVAAAAVLGSGRVVPVLQPAQLVRTALAWHPEAAAAAPAPPAASVLVVEDSITARLLLKGILESAGYRVSTAVDGLDALNQLAGELFAAVVSDIGMPHLNGFDLVARIRADERTARVPVLLVTALGNAADRERGLAAGADAYLVKGEFEQSDLLEALRKLLR